MASLYNPDAGAQPEGWDYIKILSQRDLSSQIPINFVTVPGVSLRAACFPFNRYGVSSGTKCFSNLLANGFRRFDLDLYWDASRAVWSFCPVELGSANPTLSSSQQNTQSSIATSTASLSDGELTASPQSTGAKLLRLRQDSMATTSSTTLPMPMSATSESTSTIPTAASSMTLNSSSAEPATTSSSGPPSFPDVDSDTLVQVGDYSCSPTLNFRVFLDALEGNLEQTEDSLNATMKYLTLNLHAASPASDPGGPPEQPSAENLPRNSNLLSNLILANNSQYLYPADSLFSQRANLNDSGSWYTVDSQRVPDSEYFQLDPTTDYSSTPDGWPSESYVEFSKAKRFLAGFGTVDPSMSDYNFSADESTIFQQNYLQEAISVSLTRDGTVTSGCLYNPNVQSIESQNASWAIASVGSLDSPTSNRTDIFTRTITSTANLTSCGITPLLNTTLSNTTADLDFTPYKAFVLATIWSWDVDEPKNTTSDPADRDSSTANRCAVLNATSTRWQTHDCDSAHRAACRVRLDPYNFQISDDSGDYYKGSSLCPDDMTFAAPRTALENNYLINSWHGYRSSHSDVDDELLWVDFNDLNSASCWVIGQNATCPYQPTNKNQGREVIVPTVAAVIVFVVALLLIFVKCAANRRNTRRRRKRGDDGWDYEGVPS